MTKFKGIAAGQRHEDWYQLPDDWWGCLKRLVREKWNYSLAGFFRDQNAKISERHLRRSKKKPCQITEDSVRKLAHGLGYDDWKTLLVILGGDPERKVSIAAGAGEPARVTRDEPRRYPKTQTLTAGEDTPQGAGFRDLRLWNRLERVSCTVVTSSPYFRFGFKMLPLGGKMLGDGSIQSQDSNLVVHVGRNNFNRPGHSSPKELFVTAYRNGVRTGPDQALFSVPKTLHVPIELSMDDSGMVRLVVKGRCCYSTVVPVEVGRQLLMLGWADHDYFELTIEDLKVECAK